MGKIVCIANQKGGVGKTTTAINLAASLGVLEKKILVIDCDPQANASSGLGHPNQAYEHSIYDCLINQMEPSDVIIDTATPNLSLLPSHIDLVGAELELADRYHREFVLKKVIEKVRDDYDFLIMDCLPSLGLLTINALTACDSVIIPIQCEIFALEGLSKLKNTISLVKKNLNPNLEIEGIVLSMFDKRLRLANIVVSEVRANSEDFVFDTIIHRNSKIGEAPSVHTPVIMYDVASKGSKFFLSLAYEFLQKNELNEPSNLEVQNKKL